VRVPRRDDRPLRLLGLCHRPRSPARRGLNQGLGPGPTDPTPPQPPTPSTT
jgi:hypothetical protein